MPINVIDDFSKGLILSGDPVNIPQNAQQQLQNAKVDEVGRLTKTNEYGQKFGTGLAPTGWGVYGFFTYIESHLDWDGGASGRAYIASLINSTTYRVRVYYWNGNAWDHLGNTGTSPLVNAAAFPAAYHNQDNNPIINDDGYLKVLPGYTARPSGATGPEAKGIWIGYIDRDYFDEVYSPTAGFYAYENEISEPDINFNIKSVAIADLTSDIRTEYYKFSYVYDNVQESKLSETITVDHDTANRFTEILFSIVNSNHNLRITGIKIYKASEFGGIYEFQQKINFMRKDNLIKDFYAYNKINYEAGNLGESLFYIPALATHDFSSDGVTNYSIKIGSPLSAEINILAPVNATGNYLFLRSTGWTTTVYFDQPWELWNRGVGAIESGSAGGYAGDGLLYTEEEYNLNELIEDVLLFDIYGEDYFDSRKSKIIKNKSRVVQFNSSGVGVTDLAANYLILQSSKGNYYNEANRSEVTTIQYVADVAGSLNNKYFYIYTTTQGYYVWYNVSGGGADPSIGGMTGIEVAINTGDSANAVRLATETELNSSGVFTAAGCSGKSDVKSNQPGAVTAASDAGSTGFTITIYTKGTNSSPAKYVYIDNLIPKAGLSPLVGIDHIKINGQFSRIVGDVHWIGKINIAPDSEAEEHDDWAGYSKLSQHDVFPQYQVLRISDREGGPITGLASIFGSPVFLKEHSIIKVLSTSEVTGFYAQESIHNIGNLAPLGYVEAMGKLYIIDYKGIYELSPNNLAATDQTPTENLKISYELDDYWYPVAAGGLNPFKETRAQFDEFRKEIVFYIPSAPPRVFAFGLKTRNWRELTLGSGFTPGLLMTKDEIGNLIFYGASALIYSSTEDENKYLTMQTKDYILSDFRKTIIRYVSVSYKSPTNKLNLIIVTEDGNTTFELAAQSTLATRRIITKVRAKKYSIRINEQTSNTNEVYIDNIIVYTD